jgi:hypothetical protein
MASTLGSVVVLSFLFADGRKYHERQISKEHGQIKDSNCHFGLICVVYRYVVSYFAVVPLICDYKTLYAKRHSRKEEFLFFFFKTLIINCLKYEYFLC